MSGGFGSHESQNRGVTVNWLSPLRIVHSLGEFDLDPCGVLHWPTAKRIIALPDDGFALPWSGRVWLNPPYGSPEMWPWVKKLADHGSGVALIFARTETKGFVQHVWGRAHSVMFLHGRLRFHLPDGSICETRNAGAPSCLVSYSPNDTDHLKRSGLSGTLVSVL